jgi:hypothetical protein
LVHILENTSSVYENINFVMYESAIAILDIDFPLALGFIPHSRLDSMLVLYVTVAIVFIGNIMHVVVDLFRRSVVVWPIGIRGEAESIVMCGNITLASRISEIKG